MARIKIEGMDELLKQLDGLPGDIAGDIHDAAFSAAESMAERIRAEARPFKKTGKLEKSIQARPFKKRAGKPIGAMVRIDHKIAPHAINVEFGHHTPDGAGFVPGVGYFARGYEASKNDAISTIVKSVKAALAKAVK